MGSESGKRVVKCPEQFAPLFGEAERMMDGFFSDFERRPERGDITIGGVRYLMMRTESLAIELHEELRKTFGEAGARQIRYKIAKACGSRDARMFHKRLGVEDPNMRLALGPVHFAHVGWANVDIFPESAPQPNENYFLVYDHPFSFEARAFLDNGIKADKPVCVMNAGYSTGWCEASYGIDLRAEELTCRARGDEKCVFVMAHPKRFDAAIRDYREKARI